MGQKPPPIPSGAVTRGGQQQRVGPDGFRLGEPHKFPAMADSDLPGQRGLHRQILAGNGLHMEPEPDQFFRQGDEFALFQQPAPERIIFRMTFFRHIAADGQDGRFF